MKALRPRNVSRGAIHQPSFREVARKGRCVGNCSRRTSAVVMQKTPQAEPGRGARDALPAGIERIAARTDACAGRGFASVGGFRSPGPGLTGLGRTTGGGRGGLDLVIGL